MPNQNPYDIILANKQLRPFIGQVPAPKFGGKRQSLIRNNDISYKVLNVLSDTPSRQSIVVERIPALLVNNKQQTDFVIKILDNVECKREIDITLSIKHPNFVKTFEHFELNNKTYLVQEKLESVHMFLSSFELKYSSRIQLIHAMMSVVSHFHQHNLAIVNLTLEAMQQAPNGEFKLADVISPQKVQLENGLMFNSDQTLSGPEFQTMTAEQIEKCPKCDLHPLGVLIIQILTKCRPSAQFIDNSFTQILLQIKNRMFAPFSVHLNLFLSNLLCDLDKRKLDTSFDFFEQYQKFQFIAIPESSQLFQEQNNIQFNQLMTKANGMTQYLVEEINEQWHFAAHFKSLTYKEKIKAMLETYELFLIGMQNKLKLVNIAKNLYYFVNLGSIKTKINSCACIMNDPQFVDKNIMSMCMFLQSFKHLESTPTEAQKNAEQLRTDAIQLSQSSAQNPFEKLKQGDKFNFLIVVDKSNMFINDVYMQDLRKHFKLRGDSINTIMNEDDDKISDSVRFDKIQQFIFSELHYFQTNKEKVEKQDELTIIDILNELVEVRQELYELAEVFPILDPANKTEIVSNAVGETKEKTTNNTEKKQ